MRMEFQGNRITFEREPSSLDRMAIYFSKKLRDAGIEHVFVSGYIAILFGRNRASEDIDVIIDRISMESFLRLWNSLGKTECIITQEPREAYSYLKDGLALRFSWKGEIIPNIEMKFARTDAHREALRNRLDVMVNGNPISISPLELQIAYKLLLGSDKDIGDARFLFDLFGEKLDLNLLMKYIRTFGMDEKMCRHYLGWSNEV